MPDVVRVAAGTLLKMSDGASTFTNIAEVETIGEIEEQRPEVRATNLAATAERFIAGIKEGQPIEVSMFLLTDSPTQRGASTGIYYVFKQNLEREYVIAPKGTAYQYRFSAIITRHRMGGFSSNDPMRRTVTLRITSDVTEEANTNP